MQNMNFFEAVVGPKVVLFHSSASSAGQWKTLMERYSDSFHFIAINLIGYGKNQRLAQW